MSYNKLIIGGFVQTPLVGADRLLTEQWATWFATGLVPAVNNVTPIVIPGPFANDAAAQAGGVPLQGLYYDVSGVPHVRIV